MSYHDKAFRERGTPPLLERRGFFCWTQMWMPNKNGAECLAESESLGETLKHAFRHVYAFILQAVKGDKAAADAIFEDYLAGKRSEELLSISRRWVSTDQAASSKRESEEDWAADNQLSARAAGGVGVRDAFTALS